MVGEVAADGLFVPEGPVVLPDGRIAFVEQIKGRVSVYSDGKVETLAETKGAPNAVTIGSDGNLYAAQNGGVVGDWRSSDPTAPGIQKIGLDGTVTTVATSVGGLKTLAPNDLAFGPDGRLYFTDPAHGYDPVNRGEDGRIFALDADGGELLTKVGPSYPNGIGFKTDGQLVWVESYERDLCTLVEGRKKVIGRLPEDHIPDGFAAAQDGRLYITTVTSRGVTVISPDGEVLELLKLDDDALATNCCFDGSTLWVTDFGPDYEKQPDGGRLWRIATDAVGAPLYPGSLD